MLEVRIGDKTIDASDFDAVVDASREVIEKRTAQILAEKEVTREELIESLNYVMAMSLAIYSSLGSLLIVRETSGLHDDALRMLREVLANTVGVQGGSAANEAEPGIIMPDEVRDERSV